MPKYAAKADANQSDIVKALQKHGATVQHLHNVGMGCPDILVGFRNVNTLIEIKDGSKPPSARRLTPPQEVWHLRWRGQKAVAKNVQEALAAIGIEHRGAVS